MFYGSHVETTRIGFIRTHMIFSKKIDLKRGQFQRLAKMNQNPQRDRLKPSF